MTEEFAQFDRNLHREIPVSIMTVALNLQTERQELHYPPWINLQRICDFRSIEHEGRWMPEVHEPKMAVADALRRKAWSQSSARSPSFFNSPQRIASGDRLRQLHVDPFRASSRPFCCFVCDPARRQKACQEMCRGLGITLRHFHALERLPCGGRHA